MSTSQAIAIGHAVAGGFYFGRISIAGEAFNLVVAPKEGDTRAVWLPDYVDVPGATSFFDGAANTEAMAAAGSPSATWVKGLSIGGFSDWYIPSRDELELLYRNLKPTSEENYVWRSGDNPSSCPVGYPYTDTVPGQTEVASFREGGDQALEDTWYWSSTQSSRNLAWGQTFDVGDQNDNVKAYEGRARAVRRFKAE